MHVETTNTTPASPCIATGGERVFARACRDCSAFALSCFPPRRQAHTSGTPATPKAAPDTAADDLKAMQRASAGSPCMVTGGSRTLSRACRDCSAFALGCHPAWSSKAVA